MSHHIADLAADLETLLATGEISAAEYAEAQQFLAELVREAEGLS